jgi:hypothetical protein
MKELTNKWRGSETFMTLLGIRPVQLNTSGIVVVQSNLSEKSTVFGMRRRISLVRSDVSEERVAFIFNVERISEPGTLAVI